MYLESENENEKVQFLGLGIRPVTVLNVKRYAPPPLGTNTPLYEDSPLYHRGRRLSRSVLQFV